MYLLLLLNASYLAEKQQTPVLYSLVRPDLNRTHDLPEILGSTLTIASLIRLQLNVINLI